MRLSALAIRDAKTREKAYKLGDGHGLYLLVKPRGIRLCLVSIHVRLRPSWHADIFFSY